MLDILLAQTYILYYYVFTFTLYLSLYKYIGGDYTLQLHTLLIFITRYWYMRKTLVSVFDQLNKLISASIYHLYRDDWVSIYINYSCIECDDNVSLEYHSIITLSRMAEWLSESKLCWLADYAFIKKTFLLLSLCYWHDAAPPWMEWIILLKC